MPVGAPGRSFPCWRDCPDGWVCLYPAELRRRSDRSRPVRTLRVVAGAIEREGVPLDRESGGGQLVDAGGAGLDFENLLAIFAEEMVVVVGMLALVVRRRPGNLDDFDRPHVHEESEGAVNGGDALAGGQGTGFCPDFGWSHRTPGIFKGFLDGGTLSGRVVHVVIVSFKLV
jgi:hypothetical protein